VLGVDCCWIQTIADKKQKKLALAAERGFNPEIRREIAEMDMGHVFSQQILGLGHIITIPDLSNDGLYGIPSFKNTGFKWLVAVPLMTYRAHGIMGASSSNRKLLEKDTPDLIMTIAGLIAAALMKAQMSKGTMEIKKVESEPEPIKEPVLEREPEAPEKIPEAPVNAIADETPTNITTPEIPANSVKAETPPPVKPPERTDGVFHSHAVKMETFRKKHG
jgi:hypothetical protein